ncbi:MAG TPA: ABC transporter substrate-binding protein [Dehalococcoidia bacterium]|nr:ABC transporter substrate-binding protein [Dehalococcoidia bacterium]
MAGKAAAVAGGFGRRAVQRRALLMRAGAAAAATGVAPLIACGGRNATRSTGSSGASQAAKQPKKGGVLNYAGGSGYAYDTQGRTFDPTVQTQFGAKGYNLFYERLLAYNLRNYAIEPELAQKWEQPSQTEYVFHLQPGVKWHDKPPVNGRLLVADDIVWTLERARTDDPKFFSRSLLTQVDKISAPDSSTVRVTTKTPDVATLQKLSVENLDILAREVIEKYPKPTTADSAVGTGAFIMKAVEEKVSSEYVRNPAYWKPGTPYMDGFRTKSFENALTAWAAFVANQVDIAQVPGTEVKNYIAQQGQGFTPDWYPDDTLVGYLCPNIKAKPMDDARVTRALRLLIDHDEMIKAWAEPQNGRGRFGSIFPAVISDWDLTDDEYRTHLEWKPSKDDAAKEAISLLSAAGFTKDNPLKFPLDSQSTGSLAQMCQLLQAQWKKYSQGAVDITLKLTETAQLDTIRASRSFTYGNYGFSTGLFEPGIWLNTTYRTGGSVNFLGLSDSKLDAMIDKQQGTFDDKQRRAAVKEIILYMIDNGPSTIGANLYYLYGAKPRVQGYAPEHALNGRQYQWIWLDA